MSNLFDKMSRSARECCNEILQKLDRIINENIMTEYGREEVKDVLQYYLRRGIPALWIDAEDWDFYYKKGKIFDRFVKGLNELEDAIIYEVETIWGIEPTDVEEFTEDKNLADTLKKAVEIVRQSKIPEDILERELEGSIRAVREVLREFVECMFRKVPELTRK